MTDEKSGLRVEQQTTVKQETVQIKQKMFIPNPDIEPDIKLEGIEQSQSDIKAELVKQGLFDNDPSDVKPDILEGTKVELIKEEGVDWDSSDIKQDCEEFKAELADFECEGILCAICNGYLSNNQCLDQHMNLYHS